MDNEKKQIPGETTPEEKETYVPRPVWQVWMARVGLVFFILFVIWQLVQIATAGML